LWQAIATARGKLGIAGVNPAAMERGRRNSGGGLVDVVLSTIRLLLLLLQIVQGIRIRFRLAVGIRT
jgi:hypothetical protein